MTMMKAVTSSLLLLVVVTLSTITPATSIVEAAEMTTSSSSSSSSSSLLLLSNVPRLRHGRSVQSLTNETGGYVSGPQVNQDLAVDFPYCFAALARHDENDNQRIDQQEYLSFVQDLGRNTECLGGLTRLPIEIMACWNQLSCECQNRGGATDCCEGDLAHIPITGVNAQNPNAVGSTSDSSGSGSTSSKEPYILEEQSFLNQTCLRTDQCVIAYCGTPPPPIIPPPATVVPVVVPVPPPSTGASKTAIAFAALAGLLVLVCCLRRRWCFFAGAKANDDEDESSSESEVEEEMEGGGARHLVTEEEGEELGDIPPVAVAAPLALAGEYNDPDANRQALRAGAEDEDGEGGGVMYSRSVQEPEYEEDPVPPGPKAIEQFDPPPPPKEDFALNHIEKDPPPPPEEEPYALEHYVPDGGIVEYERSGDWRHDADGGWTPEERQGKDPSEWNKAGFERAEALDSVPVDNRRHRTIEAMGGGAIFDHLDEEETESTSHAGGGIGDMFSWVISSTLSTLDQKQDDLRSSGHSRRSDP